jgi:hypothetical protein
LATIVSSSEFLAGRLLTDPQLSKDLSSFLSAFRLPVRLQYLPSV